MTDRLLPLPWHGALWGRIERMEEGGRLPHALLLAGGRGLGKERFAWRLAVRCTCESPRPETRPCGACPGCHQALAGSHPDLVQLSPPKGAGSIGVGAVRDLIGSNSLTSARARRKVAIAVPADALTVSAANTLLKTLEEPAGASLFVLVTSRPIALPATVLSRCQRLDFHAPGRDQGLAWLQAQGEPGQGADEARLIGALREAHGAPLRALERLEQGTAGMTGKLATDLIGLLAGHPGEPLEIAAGWRRYPPEELWEGLVEALEDLIRLRMGTGSRIVSADPPMQSVLAGLDLDVLYGLRDRALAVRRERSVHQGLNEALLAEGFACAVPACRRRR